MNKKSHYYGMYLFLAVALLALPIWWMSYPETTVKHNFSSFHVYSSQITALLGFSFFALSFVLSTCLKILEDLFGGLDKVNHSSDATHTSVFQELQKVMPSFSMHLVCRDRDGFVKMGDIVMKDIFICGPKEMRKALLSESKKLNIWRKISTSRISILFNQKKEKYPVYCKYSSKLTATGIINVLVSN